MCRFLAWLPSTKKRKTALKQLQEQAKHPHSKAFIGAASRALNLFNESEIDRITHLKSKET